MNGSTLTLRPPQTEETVGPHRNSGCQRETTFVLCNLLYQQLCGQSHQDMHNPDLLGVKTSGLRLVPVDLKCEDVRSKTGPYGSEV